MVLKVKYFAADSSKSLICRAFIKAKMILFCMYVEFCIMWLEIFSNVFLHSSLIWFFFVSLLLKDTNLKVKRLKNTVYGCFKRSRVKEFLHIPTGEQHLTSVLWLLLLGKFMNRFWEVKSNPEVWQETDPLLH